LKHKNRRSEREKLGATIFHRFGEKEGANFRAGGFGAQRAIFWVTGGASGQ
jgi:hypothetical protein